ncbi:Cysteine desulfurase [Candidatus Defluviicoccus seviourii]|uniref:Cysteine desulfurase n=1 Tax=Candidatus Defluviicoccus seviourii TaxID=2565273 RepID=A0A564WIK3_9PROT|nr:Cysteine desulfurase [Candidatus Defluviicoccus seviourii]
MQEPTYLDYNAGAPLKPAARAAMVEALAVTCNPSSVHAFGRAARRIIEAARRDVAVLLNAPPSAVIFTSGATEANNAALKAAAPGRVLVSAIEHLSILAAVPQAQRLPVLPSGVIDLAALEDVLAGPEPAELVAVMAVNNETGVIQPIAAVAALARRFGARLHVDAVQAAGRIPLDAQHLGVASMSLSAHKLGGPQGAGALVLLDDARFRPLIKGGGQERSRRAGTENVAAIAGFAAAAREAARLEEPALLAPLRDRLESLVTALVPETVVIAAASPRVANTACLSLPGVRAETLVIALDLEGYAVSAGAACSSGKVKASDVLQAMGVAPQVAAGAVRVSLGWTTDGAAVDGFANAWERVAARLVPHRGGDDARLPTAG